MNEKYLTSVLVIGLVALAAFSGVASADGHNGTATPAGNSTQGQNTTQNNSTNQNSTQTTAVNPASLVVLQPHYVDGGSRRLDNKSSGPSKYKASGEQLRLVLRGLPNESSVVSYSVREDHASLAYDKQAGQYILETAGKTGTYRVTWTVSTPDGRETHTADIRVEQASYQVLSDEKYSRLTDSAAIGRTVQDTFGKWCDGCSVDEFETFIEEDVQQAFLFFRAPLEAWMMSFTGALTILFVTPGGWSLVGSFVGTVVLVYVWKTRESRVARRQMQIFGDLDDAQREARERDRKRILSEMEYQDLGFTDRDSKMLRDVLGPNPWAGHRRLREIVTDWDSAKIYLRAMEGLGYSLAVYESDSSVDEVTLTKEEVGDCDRVIDPTEAGKQVANKIDWTSVDPRIVYEIESSTLLTDGIISREPSEGDVIDELDIQIMEDGNPNQYHWKTREEAADALASIIRAVAATEFTDEDGVVREEADLFNVLWLLTAQPAEKFSMPEWHRVELLALCRDRLDSGEKLVETSREIAGGRL